MTKTIRPLVLLFSLSLLTPAGFGGVITLATTTSTENSGLLRHIHPDFEQKTGHRVKVIARGTGASLQLARQGDVDVVLVHAPSLEREFVSEGFGNKRHPVMFNDFVIIGPTSDPAGIRGTEDAPEAFARIAAHESFFISRGDNSGTHVMEQSLWKESKYELSVQKTRLIVNGREISFTAVRPLKDWYLSVGQGMGETIHFATEKEGYTLTDRGTYIAFARAEPPRTGLTILCEGDTRLRNSYSVIVVNPDVVPGVNAEAGAQYAAWITSSEVQALIGAFRIKGEPLFHPWPEKVPAP